VLAAALRLGGIVLFLAGAAAAVAAAVQWLLTSPRFAVAFVEVQGTSRLSPAEVREAAAISPGENLFRLNSEEVVGRLRQLGAIKRAEVIRSFPNHVTLVVEERVPFTLAQAGRLYWLDEDGVSLGPEPRAITPRLPVVTGIRPEEIEKAGEGGARARGAVSLIRSMLRTGSPLTREISEIDMSGTDGPVLYTVDGVEVRLGTADWEDRLGRLDGVLTQIRSLGEPVEYVDLRFRGQVVFKPRLR
jgi:cell division protein FtsQ